MKINVEDWVDFEIGRLYKIYNGKCSDASSLLEGDEINYIGAKRNDNGVMKRVKKEAELVSKGNCVVFICQGEGSAGYATYQDKDFIGATSLKLGYIDGVLNERIGNFLAALHCLEKPKYNHGRGWGKTLSSSMVKLPIQRNLDGSPVKDNKFKYSEKGYIPDWQFMEDYIQTLQYKPLTTKRSHCRKLELCISDWQEFLVDKIFSVFSGKGITKEELEDNVGDFEAVQSGEENNGVIGKIDFEYCKSKKYIYTTSPCLTIARTGTAGFTSFHRKGCVVGDSAKILVIKNETATTNQYLFLRTILEADRFKYTYGRKVKTDKLKDSVIKLPIKCEQDGSPIIDKDKIYSDKGYVPDWQFMEDYINSLPYSDRLSA